MPATIRDIARKCGVSEGTVDRALNNRCGIKQETKDLILKTAKELNYQSNHLASCLARGRTMNIGVVCAGLSNTFFSRLVEEIEKMARQNGYFITLILTHNSVEREREGIRYLASRQVDGLIIIPMGQGEEFENELLQYDIPIVTIYNKISDKIVHVDVDGRQIMRNAVSFISSRGYSRVAYIEPGYNHPGTENKNRYSFEQRRLGYLDGIKDEMLDEPIIFTNYDEDKILDFVREKDGKPAILCAFDNVALKLLNIFRNNGISVPGDVGLMGFDNVPMLNFITPRIYSVDCEAQGLVRKAFNMLLRQIEGDKDVSNCVTGYTFTEGTSL